MNLDALDDPTCLGLSGLTLTSREAFWSEDDLPFLLHGSGVLRLEPRAGFRKSLLAATSDELAVLPDCPDAPGWLAPEGLVARWMARHVANDRLDDLLLSHPLYTHLVKPDAQGRSRGGRARLVHWTPGVPTVAHLAGPEFLPDDRSAPAVNRQRANHKAACQDLLDRLHESFQLADVELTFAFAPRPWPAGGR